MHPSFVRAARMIRRLKQHVRAHMKRCNTCMRGHACACRVLNFSQHARPVRKSVVASQSKSGHCGGEWLTNYSGQRSLTNFHSGMTDRD